MRAVTASMRVCCQYNAFLLVSIRADSFVGKLLKSQFVETWCSRVFFSIYDYIIIFVQVNTFVTEHHSIAAKINSINVVYIYSFFNRLILFPDIFVLIGHSVSTTFLVPQTFATSVEWMTRAVHQRLRKFL